MCNIGLFGLIRHFKMIKKSFSDIKHVLQVNQLLTCGPISQQRRIYQSIPAKKGMFFIF